jgi:hypothetical protein
VPSEGSPTRCAAKCSPDDGVLARRDGLRSRLQTRWNLTAPRHVYAGHGRDSGRRDANDQEHAAAARIAWELGPGDDAEQRLLRVLFGDGAPPEVSDE